jgi:hypothetical protein
MNADVSDQLISLLVLLRSGIWLVLIAEVLVGQQAKQFTRRLAGKDDCRPSLTNDRYRVPGAGRVSFPTSREAEQTADGQHGNMEVTSGAQVHHRRDSERNGPSPARSL